MIYATLLGGIGNIMFIIASTYALALDNNDEAVFSTSLDSITRRKNERWWFETLFRKIKRGNGKAKMIYREPNFTYKKLPYYPNMRLNGYFQSSKYFDHRREEILELFLDYRKDIESTLQLKMDLIGGKKISLHIRRADYLKLQHVHVVQSMDYYKEAIAVMKESLGDSYKEYSYLIFSDDINWCKEQPLLKSLPDVHFIDGSDGVQKGPQEVFELYLMSMCDHHIIANSSFSWWGAYLNTNPNKIVVAPKNWFNPPSKGGNGPAKWDTIYGQSWITR